MCWFDSLDLIVDGARETDRLRIAWNCSPDERPLYESRVSDFAAEQGLELELGGQSDQLSTMAGCPDLVLKTTPEHVAQLAHQVSDRHHLRCIALTYHGVVLGYAAEAANIGARLSDVVREVEGQLHERGGDWRSRHLEADEAVAAETGWLRILQQEFAAP